MINLIFARDESNVIGVNGHLPWKLKSDLVRFKLLTLNRTVVMGRRTFESLDYKPLPNRRNVVITRFQFEGVECVQSLSEFLSQNSDEEIFIIGGQRMFEEGLKYADTIYETRVRTTTTGALKTDLGIVKFTNPLVDFKMIHEGRLLEKNPKDEFDSVFRIYTRASQST